MLTEHQGVQRLAIPLQELLFDNRMENATIGLRGMEEGGFGEIRQLDVANFMGGESEQPRETLGDHEDSSIRPHHSFVERERIPVQRNRSGGILGTGIPALGDDGMDLAYQGVGFQRLHEVVADIDFDPAHSGVQLGVACHQDDGEVGKTVAPSSDKLQVGVSRHVDIGDQ